MRGRLIKVSILFCMVMLLSATTMIVSRETEPREIPAAQVRIQPVAEMAPEPLPPLLAEFVQFMEHELDSSNTVGAAFTIVQGGRVVYTASGSAAAERWWTNTPFSGWPLYLKGLVVCWPVYLNRRESFH